MEHGNLVGGQWHAAHGPEMQSLDPFNGSPIWKGTASTNADVHDAVVAARSALDSWSNLPLSQRQALLEAYAQLLERNKLSLAELISQEVGKPLWESSTEVSAMIGKVAISVKAFEDRCGTKETPMGDALSVTRFKPHGAVAVFGPFNFPGHLPNGHIVPALLAGNTVIFKPSELAPAVGQRMVKLLTDSGLPPGVINLVQGGRDTGIALASEPDLDGLFFTGSSAAGKAIHRNYAGQPEKILALEMGGNNPLIVHDMDDLDAAVYWTIQSAYITSGQRCVCARRLIVTESPRNKQYLAKLLQRLPKICLGHYRDQPEPFMGPLISAAAAERVLSEQSELVSKGGCILKASEQSDRSAALLSPGLVDVTSVTGIRDEEIFGPLLQLIRVADLDEAIELSKSNGLRFGSRDFLPTTRGLRQFLSSQPRGHRELEQTDHGSQLSRSVWRDRAKRQSQSERLFCRRLLLIPNRVRRE